VLSGVTATSGIDYTYTGGIATIIAGTTGVTIKATTLQDTGIESNETFNIVLSSPVGATIADSI